MVAGEGLPLSHKNPYKIKDTLWDAKMLNSKDGSRYLVT